MLTVFFLHVEAEKTDCNITLFMSYHELYQNVRMIFGLKMRQKRFDG